MADWQILQGHCLDVLRTLPDESADCVVTSPPYLLGSPFIRRSGRCLGRQFEVRA